MLLLAAVSHGQIPATWHLAWVVAVIVTGVVVTALGVWRNDPGRETGWHTFLLGMVIYSSGDLVFAGSIATLGRDHAVGSAAVLLGILGLIPMFRGLRRVLASGRGYLDREAITDAAVATTGMGYLGYRLIVAPQIARSGFGAAGVVDSTIFWMATVLVFGLILARLLDRGGGSPSLWMTAVAVAAAGSSSVIYRGVEYTHVWESAPVARACTALAYAGIAAAVWHPSMRQEQRARETRRVLPGLALLTVGALAVAVGIFVGPLGIVRTPDVDVAGMLAAGVSIVLFVARVALTVTAREEAKAEVAAREARFRSLVEHSFDGTLLTDVDGYVIWGNRNTGMVTGRGIEQISDRPLNDEVVEEDRAGFDGDFEECVATPNHVVRGQVRLEGTGNDQRWVEYSMVNQLHNSAVGAVVVNYRDITDNRRARDELVRQATHDMLTGLPNRTHLVDRLAELTQPSCPLNQLAVMFLDLDHFKIVNDSLGHHVGDQMLITVADRLRETIGDRGFVARLGGDEFVLVCDRLRGRAEAVEVAAAVCDALQAPIYLRDHELQTNASVGIAFHDDRADTPESLLRDADTAMYRAKAGGRNGFLVYDREWGAASQNRLALENALRRALDRDALQLHYQPIVRLSDGRTIGVEALLRWSGDVLGGGCHPTIPDRPSPAHVIAVAEESGLIRPLGDWVVRRACRDLATMRAAAPEDPLTVAVNVSGAQLRRPGFAAVVRDALRDAGLRGGDLVVELTESVLVDESTAAATTMEALREAGVQLAMDDFGTGYSALTNLKRFPFTSVKIDRGFIDGLGEDEDDTAIVRAVVGMATALNLRVVAEGVETDGHLEALREMHCSHAQGYLLGKPMALNDLLARLGAEDAGTTAVTTRVA